MGFDVDECNTIVIDVAAMTTQLIELNLSPE